MTSHVLCENCLQDEAKGVPIGHFMGTQQDSYQDSLFLCEGCKKAILAHDLFSFADRFRTSRTIQNTRKS